MATRPGAAAALESSFRGRTVLLTGHTGFKGGWLALWLEMLGARVVGVALPPVAGPSFCTTVDLPALVDSRLADICDRDALAAAIADVDAEILIHMAAQSLVRPSYRDPVNTLMTNAVGTAMVLDAARRMPSLKAIVVVTSDKCYDNREWIWGYRESDPMGGADPYSASKGCAELVAACFRRSYFSHPSGPALATARSGNVFGGGDWAPERLVPDIVAAFETGRPAVLRNPNAIRPWQHVLDPLNGYLMLAAALLADGPAYAKAWNFGPDCDGIVDVATLASEFAEAWGDAAELAVATGEGPHEANTLRLDSTLARTALGWRPQFTLGEAIALTVAWHRAHLDGSHDMRAVSADQIRRHMSGTAVSATERRRTHATQEMVQSCV